MGVKEYLKRRSLRVRDDKTTKAAELSLRESLYPICLVTVYVLTLTRVPFAPLG